MLPESFILELFCGGVAIVVLVLGDNASYHNDWPNVKVKLVGIMFSTFGAILSIIPQRYDIQTSTNTVVYYNQTVDLTPITPSTGTPIDFTRFVIFIIITVICVADLLINLAEDPFPGDRGDVT